MMSIAFVVSVLLFAIALTAEGIIHVRLDSRNGHQINYGSEMGHVYILHYDKQVLPEDECLKRICNRFQKASVFFLVLLAITGTLKFILK